MLIQLLYVDDRLSFSKYSPNRTKIIGEQLLRSQIWAPHVYIVNEKESLTMGYDEKDIHITIYPDGEVVYASRLTATLYCWMNLKKFPFDQQKCDIILKSCKL